mmetsp:Transcript_59838/g.175560  ORF Transcript_59838/g.175560 Transcript_59838/m.175560 type:complete len:880 (+) Transcript_59838:138-2777(+)
MPMSESDSDEDTDAEEMRMTATLSSLNNSAPICAPDKLRAWRMALATQKTRTEVLGLIGKSLVFKDTTESFRTAILDSLFPAEFQMGQQVCDSHHRGDWLALVYIGKLKCTVDRGGSVETSFVTPGGVVGDPGIFGCWWQRGVTAVAEDVTTVLVLTQEGYNQAVQKQGVPRPLAALKDADKVSMLVDDVASFTALECFRGLDEAVIESLHRNSEPRLGYPGQTLIQEDDLGAEMYIILSGGVTIFKGGKKIIELPSGIAIGELAVLGPDKRRTATVVCSSLCIFQSLHTSTFAKVIKEHQGAGDQCSDLGTESVYQFSRQQSMEDQLQSTSRDASPQASREALLATRGTQRPKWRLCFRLDRRGMKTKEKSALPWKYQCDFFIAVVDPPAVQVAPSQPPAPFYASENACQVANLLVSRPTLEQLPGHSFQGKLVAAVGKDCLVAGLVAAMLGAKVALVTESHLLGYAQHNLQLYLKETLDYTKCKSQIVDAIPAPAPGGPCVRAAAICQHFGSPHCHVDIVLVTESVVDTLLAIGGAGAQEDDDENDKPGLFDVLDDLVPPGALTRVLLLCDSQAGSPRDPDEKPKKPEGGLPPWLSVPPGWRARPFCQLPGQRPVVWLEREDAEPARRPPLAPLRRYLPPMGASSSRCGCGGHPQKTFLNHTVHNQEWVQNRSRLKQALAMHNSWKQGEANSVLEEARSWAASYSPMDGSRSRFESTMSSLGSPSATDAAGSATDSLGGSLDMAMTLTPRLPPAGAPPLRGPRTLARSLRASHRVEGELPRASSAPAGTNGGYRPRPNALAQTLPPTMEASDAAAASEGDRSRELTLNLELDALGAGYAGAAASTGRRQVRGPTIAERHASPPFWYRCNRPVYASLR